MTTKKPHYVDNEKFSKALAAYAETARAARAAGTDPPQISDYIADCFLRLTEGFLRKSSFRGYTWAEEMRMDAVENLIKAADNYDIKASTRGGKPNAFAYCTQIIYYAFLRRIGQENSYVDAKMQFLQESSLLDSVIMDPNSEVAPLLRTTIDGLKDRIAYNRRKDELFREYQAQQDTAAADTKKVTREEVDKFSLDSAYDYVLSGGKA